MALPLTDAIPTPPSGRGITELRAFGDYDLLGQIGRGGMGVVYRARQRSLNRVVAVKMLLNSALSSPAMVRRFEMEAETVARLDHPHIVPIYEVREEDGQRYFSMKLIEGESLSQQVRRGEFEAQPANGLVKERTWDQIQDRIVRLMVAIARAVHYAHRQGVLHRDLKPGNILIDRAGEPHLTDFGLAKCFDGASVQAEDGNSRTQLLDSLRPGGDSPKHQLTGSGEILGTPAYMAPEQITGRPASPLTDVYSLGAILYELLTGKIPFAAATPLETFRQIEQRDPARPESVNSHVARDLSVICLKCMEKDPGRRYSTALALAEDLERWLHNEPIQARTAGPVLRLRRWIRRNRIGTALILTLVLLLGVTTTLLIVVNEAKHTADETGKELRSLLSEQDKVRYRRAMDTRVRLEELWVRPDKEVLDIGWDDLAVVSGNPFNKVTNEAKQLRLKVGLSANANPVDEARLHAPLLARLEQLMSERLGREVRLDLWMYKISGDRIPALASDKLDFARMGALPVMKALREGLPVRMLVEQINPGRRATFFTRTNMGIHSLSDLKGKSMAFGETNSTINYVAQTKLADAGITAADFSKYDFLDSLSAFMKGVEEDGIDEVTESLGGVLSSHTEVVRVVRDGEYDAGICSLKVFEKNARYGLIRIPNGEFDNVRNPWIGRSDLPPEVINSFLESMKALDEQKDGFLRTLPDHPIGFRPITEGTHESEREVMRKIQDLFPIKAPITVGTPGKTLRRKK